jgi:exo-beta-1,3-glucanase (GH17 family)
MNTDLLYNMNNFDSFNNIYTIYQKNKKVYKRTGLENKDHELVKEYTKYIPIYGHYFNANNQFVAKKVVKGKLYSGIYADDFLIIENKDIVRPLKGGIYVCKTPDELYDIINRLKQQKEE